MAEYRKTNQKDWIDIFVRLALMFLVMAAGIIVLGPANLFLWPVSFLVPLIWLILWHTNNFAYNCQNCGSQFQISFWQNMLTPHGPDWKGRGWKYVKCPYCKAWTRAEVLRIERRAE